MSNMRKFVSRTVRSRISSWARWTTLARRFGVTRDALITSVMDAACDYFEQRMEKEHLAPGEKSPGRGTNHLSQKDKRTREHRSEKYPRFPRLCRDEGRADSGEEREDSEAGSTP